jgi:DNA-binding response OmpR family regulator
MAYKVILLEDSPTVEKAVRMSLSFPDFELYTYHGIGEFLEKFLEMKPDVVLVGVSLVSRSESRTLKDWKGLKTSGKTAVILLRKVFEPVDQEKVAELDYDAVLRVPFASEGLVSLVSNLMEKNNDPLSLPEEHLLDDFSIQEGINDLDERVRALVKQETLNMGRELEKRMKLQLLTEMKDWLRKKLDEIKDKSEA